MNKHTLIYIELVLMALFWGGSFTATKIALKSLSPISLVTVRFFFTAIVFVPILIYYYNQGKRIEKKDYLTVLFLALLGMNLYFIFENTGIKFTDASKAALIINLLPMVTVYLSTKILKEKINLKQKIAIIIAFLGAFLVITNLNFNFRLVMNDLIGAFFVFIAVITVALYGVISKKILHKYDPLFLLGHNMVLAFFLFIPFFFIFEKTSVLTSISNETLFAILYLVLIASIICYWIYYRGLVRLNVSKVGVFDYLVPVFAAIIAFFILKEKITIYTIIGGLIIIGSVYVFSKSKEEVEFNP